MTILVINGSPSGENSITLQTIEFLKACFPAHTWETLHVAQKLSRLEKDFSEAASAMSRAELLIFAYPVYTFLVPAQLHRFLELIKEHHIDLTGKWATQISTSKHFYDTTAHRFIEDICADLSLRYVRGLSADMEDLLGEKGQDEAKAFFKYVCWNIAHGYAEAPRSAPADPAFSGVLASPAPKSRPKGQLRIALVADLAENDISLKAMTDRFTSRFPGECELVNLREFPFAGGCLGCFRCASDGKCFYKDGFDDYLRQHINSADAVIYAFSIKDHSMGYRMKLYDDRQFCNGHRTVTMGKPVGYLVSGNLPAEENLRTLIEGRAQVGGNFLAGTASDAKEPDLEIDRLVRRIVYAIRNQYNPPQNFYGVGGLKIFRDLIFEMQGLMKEDHRFYKEHGFYDFPQKKKGRIAGMYLVSALMNSSALKKKMPVSMTEGMLMPYRNAIKKVEQKNRS